MGPIVRLIDPQTQGEQLKPFVFLDFFDADIEPGCGFGMHPHSGIVTLTWQPDTDVAWALVFGGEARVQDQPAHRDLRLLGAHGDIEIQAAGQPVRALVGTAARHPHDLVPGPSSIHTQPSSLQAGLRRIRAIGDRLRAAKGMGRDAGRWRADFGACCVANLSGR